MTTLRYDRLETGPMDEIDAAVWSGDLFHHRENIAAFRRVMARWECGLQEAEGILRGADELAAQIDLECLAIAQGRKNSNDCK